MLSRVCLSMQDYANAEKYAEACPRLQRTLIDYNTVDRVTEQPLRVPSYGSFAQSRNYPLRHRFRLFL